jgi:hypothetical protein
MNSNQANEETPTGQPPVAEQPTHSEDGVDLTLIRWMLSLTPAERLQVLQNHVRSVLRLRRDFPRP